MNPKNFRELKRELRKLVGIGIFKLTRISSLDNGEFIRILHQVKAQEIIFYDGEKLVTLHIVNENELKFFENGFNYNNCKYELISIK